MPDLSKNHPAVKGGTTVSTSAALTSAASVGVPTKVEFDKVIADLVAVKATLDALVNGLTA